MVSSYERELRAVLAGTPDGVRAVTRSCSQLEKAKAMQVVQRPFLVVRAAGSGIEGSGDIVALRGDLCFPIEVKTTKNKKLYLSGRTSDQLKALEKEGERCGLLPLYAQRLKGVRGDSWRIFKVDIENLTGRLALLSRRIPSLPLTSGGRPMLDWEQGMPLHRFLALTCRPSDEAPLEPLLDIGQRSAGKKSANNSSGPHCNEAKSDTDSKNSNPTGNELFEKALARADALEKKAVAEELQFAAKISQTPTTPTIPSDESSPSPSPSPSPAPAQDGNDPFFKSEKAQPKGKNWLNLFQQ